MSLTFPVEARQQLIAALSYKGGKTVMAQDFADYTTARGSQTYKNLAASATPVVTPAFSKKQAKLAVVYPPLSVAMSFTGPALGYIMRQITTITVLPSDGEAFYRRLQQGNKAIKAHLF